MVQHPGDRTDFGYTNPDANLPKLGIKYDATADRRSWELLKLFLAEVFA